MLRPVSVMIVGLCLLNPSNSLSCNTWRTFTATSGTGIPSNQQMTIKNCDPGKVACTSLTYTAHDNPDLSSFCQGGACTVSEGGCTDDASCQDIINGIQMSGNDAGMDSSNDGSVRPCQGTQMMVSGHTDSSYNGVYSEQPGVVNGVHWYGNSNGKFLFAYNYQQDPSCTGTACEKHQGWALDETDPNTVTDWTADPTGWKSGGAQNLDASANDEVATFNRPVSCLQNCFGENGEQPNLRLHCVATRRLFEEDGLRQRILRGEVSNLQCGYCTESGCNSECNDATDNCPSGAGAKKDEDDDGSLIVGIVAIIVIIIIVVAIVCCCMKGMCGDCGCNQKQPQQPAAMAAQPAVAVAAVPMGTVVNIAPPVQQGMVVQAQAVPGTVVPAAGLEAQLEVAPKPAAGV